MTFFFSHACGHFFLPIHFPDCESRTATARWPRFGPCSSPPCSNRSGASPGLGCRSAGQNQASERGSGGIYLEAKWKQRNQWIFVRSRFPDLRKLFFSPFFPFFPRSQFHFLPEPNETLLLNALIYVRLHFTNFPNFFPCQNIAVNLKLEFVSLGPNQASVPGARSASATFSPIYKQTRK